LKLNYVFFAASQQDAKSSAENIFGGSVQSNVLTVSDSEFDIKIFLRWPRGLGFAHPCGITDVLIMHLGNFSDDNSEAEQYVDNREGIPVKIVFSTDGGFKAWESKGMKHTSSSGEVKVLVQNEIKSFNEKLKALFQEEQTKPLGSDQGEGFSGYRQLLQQHKIEVTFEKYKAWYVFGRTDPETWKMFTELSSVVEGLMTAKINELSGIFQSIQNDESHELSHRGKLDFRCTSPFNTGTKFGWELHSGDDFTKLGDNIPYALHHSPITLSFEIGVGDSAGLEDALGLLMIQLKGMLSAMVPQVAQAIKVGVDLHLRVSGNRLFFDLIVSGLLASVIHEHAHKVNFNLLKYAGLGNFHIASAFSPIDVLSLCLEDIVKKATQLEICGGGEFVNIKTIFKICSMVFQGLGAPEKDLKKINSVMNFINAFKMFGLDIKFDHDLMVNAIKEAINLRSSQQNKFGILSEKFSGQQMMFNGLVEQGKQMTMFIADYVSLIKNINFDNIAFNVTLPIARTFFKIYLNLTGLTQFINETFLA